MRQLLLLAFALTLSAQQPQRPRVCLTLAGGSALGFAHVGVIRWLEEHHIPIDCVAGTSMGGLVGGSYATGTNSAEMTAFLEKVNWTEALRPAAPFYQLAFRRKEDRREFPNQLEFGLKHGFSLPPGLSPGHGVGLAISRISGPFLGLKSFDDLPTPFRAVATDLVKAEQVIFDKGDLFDALRATMSLPGIFAPVAQDGKVLIDGGVINNLPVDVTRTMKPDVVIAVALHVTLPAKNGSYSFLNVTGRSLDVMIKSSELRSIADADIVLMPDLEGLGSSDFAKVREFIQRGYAAAAAQSKKLERLSVSESQWQAYLAARKARERSYAFAPTAIKADGLNAPLTKTIEKRLQPQLAHPDLDVLDRELTRLTGLGRWDSANYRLVDGTLHIQVHEKPHGPPFVSTGIQIDGATGQSLRFGAGARLTFLDVGNPGSEWRTDFAVGARDTIATEYFHRIHSSKLFIAPRAYLDQFTRDIYVSNARLSRLSSRELGAAVDLGYAAGRFSEVRVGYILSQFKNEVTIGLPGLPSFKGNVSRIRARYTFEGQDHALVATHGIRLTSTGQWVISSAAERRSFPILESELRWAHSLNDTYVLTGQFAGGATLGSQNFFSPFLLGGPLRLSALGQSQYFGRHYYFANASVLRRLNKSPISYFARIYMTAGYEMGQAFNDTANAKPYNDGVAGIVGETAVGIIFVGGAFGEQGQRKIFVRIGRYF